MSGDAENIDSCTERISLCETLDRVLNKGVVVTGDLVISVADIDLIYLGVNLILASVETARQPSPGATTVGLSGDAT